MNWRDLVGGWSLLPRLGLAVIFVGGCLAGSDARDLGQWKSNDPRLSQWFRGLMQPDTIMTEAWYWDLNDANREFAKKFAPQNKGIYPTMVHAGVYSAVTHYLKAVEALKSDADGKAVVAKMKELPTDDKLFGKGTVREDGRKI